MTATSFLGAALGMRFLQPVPVAVEEELRRRRLAEPCRLYGPDFRCIHLTRRGLRLAARLHERTER